MLPEVGNLYPTHWVYLSLAFDLPSSLALADGFVAHVESTCVLDDDGTPQDFTYCISFNKDLLTCWDPEERVMAPCEFGALNGLATYLSNYLNQQKNLLQRLTEGLQDCATHTEPFWGSLTHRTRKERGYRGTIRKHS